MFKKTLMAGAVAMALVPGFSAAADAPYTISANVGLYSDYIFRGLTQTNGDPALQGGFDFSHSSGVYLGTWASNISWLRDFGAYAGGGSMEWDFYGGYRGNIGKSDFGYDVGLLYYYYPGTVVAGGVKANTLEAYGALSWKWLSFKYSYSLDNKTFGVTDSSGTWYADLTANFPVTDKLTVTAHYGKQKYDGSTGGVSNDTNASYKDWKIGLSYALPQDFTVGAYYTDTDMSTTQEAFYTAGTGKHVGRGTGTVYISKSF